MAWPYHMTLKMQALMLLVAERGARTRVLEIDMRISNPLIKRGLIELVADAEWGWWLLLTEAGEAYVEGLRDGRGER